MIDSRGMVLRYDRTRPRHRIRFLPRLCVRTVSQPSSFASAMTASCVGPTNVPPRSTGVPAIVVVPEPYQITGRRQPREPGTHDDDVGIGWDSHATRLSRREGHDGAVRAD